MAQKTRSPTVAWVQYSKRLAAWVTVVWAVFRAACLALLIFRPELAESMKGIIQGADDVMMANIAFYHGNSVAEKGITGYFGRASQSAAGQENSEEMESNG